MKSSKPAVLLVGHGSKAAGFAGAMKKVAARLRHRKQYGRVVCAFLEVSSPSIPEAIDACVRRGASEVRVLPYFVLTGKHVTRDIPRIVSEAAKKHRDRARVVLCPYLGYHPHLVSVVRERLTEETPL